MVGKQAAGRYDGSKRPKLRRIHEKDRRPSPVLPVKSVSRLVPMVPASLPELPLIAAWGIAAREYYAHNGSLRLIRAVTTIPLMVMGKVCAVQGWVFNVISHVFTPVVLRGVLAV